MTTKSKNELVVKANKLVEASYRLDLVEQRIILFAITEARRTQQGLSADNFVSIYAKDYAELYDVNVDQAYEQLKVAARTLFTREFTLYDTHPESGKPRVITSRWLSATSYVDGAGVIQLQFAAIVIPYMTRLESEFTRYKLEQIASMDSIHGIRLYELLVQWQSVGKREITIEKLRDIFQLEDKYPAIKDLKMRVIDVAVTQINKHSDLTCSYTQRKTGRAVTHLMFEFKPKAEAKPKPIKKPPTRATKLSDDETGMTRARQEIARTKAMLDALRASR
jgi:plasmid replication initiation protein